MAEKDVCGCQRETIVMVMTQPGRGIYRDNTCVDELPRAAAVLLSKHHSFSNIYRTHELRQLAMCETGVHSTVSRYGSASLALADPHRMDGEHDVRRRVHLRWRNVMSRLIGPWKISRWSSALTTWTYRASLAKTYERWESSSCSQYSPFVNQGRLGQDSTRVKSSQSQVW